MSWLMFAVELVEGKDAPKEIIWTLTKGTTGLLLILTQTLNNTGKVVVLDSGFCVLKSLVDLRKAGVFAAAVIKNANIDQSLCLATRSMI